MITVKLSKQNEKRQIQGRLQLISIPRYTCNVFRPRGCSFLFRPRVCSQWRLSRGKNLYFFCPTLMLEKKYYIVRYATPNQVHPGNQLFYCKTYQAIFPLWDLRTTIICRPLAMFSSFFSIVMRLAKISHHPVRSTGSISLIR